MNNEQLLEYFNGDELTVDVVKKKYFLKDKAGNLLETHPDQKHERMAKEFARVHEKLGGPLKYNDILALFKNYSGIVPQGSVMALLGNPNQIGSLSNCIVIKSPYDSYGGILWTDQQLAQLMKRRCGVGVDLSTLRPAGRLVSNAAGTTTGAVSFMHRFSNTTNEVAQNGRRGALMLSLHVSHPDIMDFIKVKRDLTKVTGANISIQLSDEFMFAVERGGEFELSFDGESYGWINARDLWKEIIKSAHQYAEPGLIFADTHHDYSTSHFYPEFADICTNPCGEIMMGNDSCRLLVNNMFSCVKNPFTEESYFAFEMWKYICYNAAWLGDDLVQLESEYVTRIIDKIESDPEPTEIKMVELQTWKDLLRVGRNGRRVGIGITGLGDTLAALGIKYDSDKALEVVDNIMSVKMKMELKAQSDMAQLRGPFASWSKIQDHAESRKPESLMRFIADTFPQEYASILKNGRRSISWSTVAPTGSVSMLTQTTSGIEPLFAPFYTRRRKINPDDKDSRVDFIDEVGVKWQEYPVFHPQFKKWLESWDISSYVGLKQVSELTREESQMLFEMSPWYKSIAADIDWTSRVKMQGVIQKYTTHSISSTVNLPESATEEDVSTIYLTAWKEGLKGITVYREGSRSGVLLTEKPKESFQYSSSPKRPKEVNCDIHFITAQGEEWLVLVGLVNNLPFEVFAFKLENIKISKKYTKGVIKKIASKVYDLIVEDKVYANVTQYMPHHQENVTRLISMSLRHGANPKYIVEQLEKSEGNITSFFKAISRILKRNYLSDQDQKQLVMKNCTEDGKNCNIVTEEGCAKCLQCGLSKCG